VRRLHAKLKIRGGGHSVKTGWPSLQSQRSFSNGKGLVMIAAVLKTSDTGAQDETGEEDASWLM
jgi:hypothetical protein